MCLKQEPAAPALNASTTESLRSPIQSRAWAKLSGLPAREIGRCERAFGDALDWRLRRPQHLY
ncbi:hypothetical protein C8J56DRAFT_797215 [Mycena floridula]|nr:hypothetical protein C8J56DRAFT_797215 [Mycena floridula]